MKNITQWPMALLRRGLCPPLWEELSSWLGL